jgi:hypothetical protein
MAENIPSWAEAEFKRVNPGVKYKKSDPSAWRGIGTFLTGGAKATGNKTASPTKAADPASQSGDTYTKLGSDPIAQAIYFQSEQSGSPLTATQASKWSQQFKAMGYPPQMLTFFMQQNGIGQNPSQQNPYMRQQMLGSALAPIFAQQDKVFADALGKTGGPNQALGQKIGADMMQAGQAGTLYDQLLQLGTNNQNVRSYQEAQRLPTMLAGLSSNTANPLASLLTPSGTGTQKIDPAQLQQYINAAVASGTTSAPTGG